MTWGNIHSFSSQQEMSLFCLGKLPLFVSPFEYVTVLKEWHQVPQIPEEH